MNMAENYSKQDLTRCCQCGQPLGKDDYAQVWVYGSHALCMGLEPTMHHLHTKCAGEYRQRWKKAEIESADILAAQVVGMVERGEKAKRRSKDEDDEEEE